MGRSFRELLGSLVLVARAAAAVGAVLLTRGLDVAKRITPAANRVEILP